MEFSSARPKDSLIRETQRYKNICSENEKLDYISKNFCKDKKKKRVKNS